MPLLIDVLAQVEEALRSSSILTGVCSGFCSALARLRASFSVKWPLIDGGAAGIGSLMLGAEMHLAIEHDRELLVRRAPW